MDTPRHDIRWHHRPTDRRGPDRRRFLAGVATLTGSAVAGATFGIDDFIRSTS